MLYFNRSFKRDLVRLSGREKLNVSALPSCAIYGCLQTTNISLIGILVRLLIRLCIRL